MVTVRNTRSTKTYLEQPRLVTCISRRWQKTLIPRFKSENHIDCFLNLSIKMSRDQRPTWVVPQLTDKMKNSLKDQIARKDMWVVGGTVFLVLLLPFSVTGTVCDPNNPVTVFLVVQPVSWSRDQINQPPNSPVSRSNSCWTERGERRKLVLREQLGLGFRVLVRFMPEKVFVLFLLWAHTYTEVFLWCLLSRMVLFSGYIWFLYHLQMREAVTSSRARGFFFVLYCFFVGVAFVCRPPAAASDKELEQ